MADPLTGSIKRFNTVGASDAGRGYVLSVVVDAGGLTIRVQGNARMVQVQSLSRTLHTIIERLDTSRQSFSIDFSACTGLDSSAIGFFAMAAREFVRRGGSVALRHASERIRRMLVVLGLDQIATIMA